MRRLQNVSTHECQEMGFAINNDKNKSHKHKPHTTRKTTGTLNSQLDQNVEIKV